ncbi:MAG TPA: GSU2403 family nucleotidyltransferase fold protein [Hyphomicrobiaceae bacterium]|nr:GSU2403 family nucleotidyltransferase fold protein [Hyphomicrobiaceae bacterium]
MIEISLATQTMFAELLQRCLDAEFDETYDERGTFRKKRSKGRMYWHHQQKIRGKVVSKYVGPVTDESITDRVKRFSAIKSDYKQRQELVRALIAAGLPSPDAISGSIVEAMWKAGFFRLRGVLVGTVAFQAYAGPLGVKFGGRPLQTQDADFAQFWGISENIGESMPPMLEVLRGVDETFREVPNIDDPFVSTAYVNRMRYRVDFLTPNRGSDEHQGRPARMKALGGAGAQPLRHLDYLIHEPERSVILYKGGIPVSIPRAERYAVHKLIVAAERRDQVKSAKDIAQSASLIQALAKRRPLELAGAWRTAWEAGPKWREKLESGRARLPEEAAKDLAATIELGAQSERRRRRVTS